MASETSNLTVNILDGARQPMGVGDKFLITISNGNGEILRRDYFETGQTFSLPFHDNLFDNYTVAAFAGGYPTPQVVDIMLLRNNASFNFALAQWDALAVTNPLL